MSATQPRHQDSPGGEPAVEAAGTGYAGAARMPLSRGTRLGLMILLVAWSIHLAERFIPDDFVRLHLYLQRFASGHFWFWAAFDVLLIVLTALALVKGSNRCRLAAAGILVVTAFVADPILAVAHGGHWYDLMVPPLPDLSGNEVACEQRVMEVRVFFMWVVTWVGIGVAMWLLVANDRRSAGNEFPRER